MKKYLEPVLIIHKISTVDCLLSSGGGLLPDPCEEDKLWY